MPELPEVETLRRELERAIVGRVIKSATILESKTIHPLSARAFNRQIKNKTISAVRRRAKMLLFTLRPEKYLVVHLKMTGQLIFYPQATQPLRHTRMVIHFTDGTQLFFNDLRKFGWLKIVDETKFKLLDQALGPEPLGKDFSQAQFIKIMRCRPNRTIKQTLLDQTTIAGIGNIYADESAARAGLRPTRRVKTITTAQLARLYHALRRVLRAAIEKGGTSAKDYIRSNGKPGAFVPHLLVYGRTGAPCKHCGKKVKKIRHAGRGTHYCPHCQK